MVRLDDTPISDTILAYWLYWRMGRNMCMRSMKHISRPILYFFPALPHLYFSHHIFSHFFLSCFNASQSLRHPRPQKNVIKTQVVKDPFPSNRINYPQSKVVMNKYFDELDEPELGTAEAYLAQAEPADYKPSLYWVVRNSDIQHISTVHTIWKFLCVYYTKVTGQQLHTQ